MVLMLVALVATALYGPLEVSRAFFCHKTIASCVCAKTRPSLSVACGEFQISKTHTLQAICFDDRGGTTLLMKVILWTTLVFVLGFLQVSLELNDEKSGLFPGDVDKSHTGGCQTVDTIRLTFQV